jgi:hypothetical protein
MSKRFMSNKGLNKLEVTYIIVVLGLGLASQEVDVLTNQPMKKLETFMATKR